MSGIISTDIKSLLTIAVKSRSDGFTDQFNRIYMVKILLVCSMIMGLSWFKESIMCIIPMTDADDAGNSIEPIDKDFVSAACWIQGLYIYREMKDRVKDAAYYGIPNDIGLNGITPKGTLCRTKDQLGNEKPLSECRPMEKTFFLQYQYMPFYVGAIAILYYLPYMFYLAVNDDLSSLKNTIKDDIDEDKKSKKIAQNYFHRQPKQRKYMIVRILLNILCKIIYIVANVVALFGTDAILNGEYAGFGKRWIKWASSDNAKRYDYMGPRRQFRAGDVLLPAFGYCDVFESAIDKLITKANQYTFVCELSQNVLYQYCLIIMWCMIILAFLLSLYGLFVLLVHYVMAVFTVSRQSIIPAKIYRSLTYREVEYLYLVRKKSKVLFERVIVELNGILHTSTNPDAVPLVPRSNSTSDDVRQKNNNC